MPSHVVTESLFKKYRPRSWDEVVGQERLVSTLRNAVVDNHVATAYLFAGPRGTGKTSSAFILAKALNCPNVDDTGNPCNDCEICRSIDGESSLGFHYITAAEKNSVQDTREIIGQARRMSPGLKRQVFLLDEVQNWARNGGTAFEPFLHALEETNIPSVFIFCTTEPNRIPETITSRVQSFKFSMVDKKDLMSLCGRILKNEGFQVVRSSDEAPRETGRVGMDQISNVITAAGYSMSGGSVRDTLSRLEEFLGTSDGSVLTSSAVSVRNAILRRGNAPKAIELINDAITRGEDPKVLTSEILDKVRECLFEATKNEATQREKNEIATMDHIAGQDKQQSSTMQWIITNIDSNTLCSIIEVYGEAAANMAWSTDPRIYLETASIKAVRLVRDHVLRNRANRKTR